jgi:hypothetical protein
MGSVVEEQTIIDIIWNQVNESIEETIDVSYA